MVWRPGCGWPMMRTVASVERLSMDAAQTVGNLISLHHGQRLHFHLCSFLMKYSVLILMKYCFGSNTYLFVQLVLCNWTINIQCKKMKCTLVLSGKVPGDDCPLVWGQCSHCFHMHCILKWLNSQQVQQQCPMCRQEWKFKEWARLSGNSTTLGIFCVNSVYILKSDLWMTSITVIHFLFLLFRGDTSWRDQINAPQIVYFVCLFIKKCLFFCD